MSDPRHQPPVDDGVSQYYSSGISSPVLAVDVVQEVYPKMLNTSVLC